MESLNDEYCWTHEGAGSKMGGWTCQHPECRKRPVIVCLCGSTRFSEAFHEANVRETLAGKIVLSIGWNVKSDMDLLIAGELTEAEKERLKKRLDTLHLRKIDLADEVMILNVGGYVGESTQREIAYAQEHGKRLRWLELPQSENEHPGKGEGDTMTLLCDWFLDEVKPQS
ncbi:MAG: hypothetical protein M3Z24_04430 [Chloroflexota bacterium]|nr:hypothetical protein [Chloroflexota bacterium]